MKRKFNHALKFHSEALHVFAQEAMHLQCLPIKFDTGMRGTILYQTLCKCYFGCMLVICRSTMHPAQLCGGFRIFISCLVCGLLVTH
jgi:hypothetical protein